MKNLINNHIVKILILIFLISNLFGSSNNINWSRRKIDNVDNLKIAKIYSEEKFWIYESYAGGKIFSCFQNEWQEFKTPEIENMENKKA